MDDLNNANELTAEQITQAWDYKKLLKKLEDAGLPVLEDAAMKVVNSVFDWVHESVTASPNKYDDMALSFLPAARAYALKLADKIAAVDKPENQGMIENADKEAQSVAANPIPMVPVA